MKAKSMKLRFLVTLHALFKHSDKDHRMNSLKLNEHLRPFGLDCTSRVLNDTVSVLREFGFDVRNKGQWDNQGVWIENRPLPDDALHGLIFSVSTNPFLSREQANEILSALRPLVTVYQEPMLESNVDTLGREPVTNNIFSDYVTISEAIRQERRVLYTVSRVRYDKETGEVYSVNEWDTLFTPKHLCQTDERLYMVGYNNTDRRIEAVDLRCVHDVRFSFKHNDPNIEKVRKTLENIDPKDYIPEKRRQLIYKGPAIFRCRGQYLEELVSMFGAPDGGVDKDARCRAVFRVDEAEIWPETLAWLSSVPGHGIRIKGPEGLTEAVRAYFEDEAKVLLDPSLRAYKVRCDAGQNPCAAVEK